MNKSYYNYKNIQINQEMINLLIYNSLLKCQNYTIIENKKSNILLTRLMLTFNYIVNSINLLTCKYSENLKT